MILIPPLLRRIAVICGLLFAALSTMGNSSMALAQGMEDYKQTSRMALQWWDSTADVDPDHLFAPGYLNYQEPIAAGQGETGVSLNELKSIVAANHAAFPALRVAILMQIAEGNRVATHWTFSGEQKGPYQGLAPTGKAISWSGISIDEYDGNGRIAKTWVVWDKDTQFRELGLIK